MGTLAFGVEIDKDVVQRILAVYSGPTPESGGPSWLSFLGHMKDSLWSVDFTQPRPVLAAPLSQAPPRPRAYPIPRARAFPCESALARFVP
jgi:hypothetical protein